MFPPEMLKMSKSEEPLAIVGASRCRYPGCIVPPGRDFGESDERKAGAKMAQTCLQNAGYEPPNRLAVATKKAWGGEPLSKRLLR